MPNEILATPSPLNLATGVEGLLTVGGTIVIPGIPQRLDAGDFTGNGHIIFPGGSRLQKVGGTALYSVVDGVYHIPKRQPFSLYGAWIQYTEFNAMIVGVKDDLGRVHGLEHQQSGWDNDHFCQIYQNSGIIGNFYANDNEGFRVDSDGSTLRFYHHTAGQFTLRNTIPIPDEVSYYTFRYQIGYLGTSILAAWTRVDQADIPVKTDLLTISLQPPSLAAVRAVDIDNFGFTAPFVGDGIATLSHPFAAASLDVPVHVVPLYIKPTDRNCGDAVIEGNTVTFESNGGIGGVFTATAGTILPGLKWLAPDVAGWVQFTYTIGGVTANCSLNVVPRLSVNGVNQDGYAEDMIQGEHRQFVATCPNAVFCSPNYPNILTDEGYIVAPSDMKDEAFGEKDVVIQVDGCGQTYFFKVHIQAMYPTPTFCGATPIHWRPPLIPDFLPTRVTMTGGTSQVKNKNQRGIYTWEVQYEKLNQSEDVACDCCTGSHTDTCNFLLQTADRLDSFYKLVKYTRYFSLIDYQTGIVYKYVRLTRYDGNHNLYKTEQTRQVSMRQEGDVLFD